jgi:hypothetical protein
MNIYCKPVKRQQLKLTSKQKRSSSLKASSNKIKIFYSHNIFHPTFPDLLNLRPCVPYTEQLIKYNAQNLYKFKWCNKLSS